MKLSFIRRTTGSAAAFILVLLAVAGCGGGSSADDLARAARPLATKSDDALKTQLRDADNGAYEELKLIVCKGLDLYQSSEAPPSQDALADIVGDQTDAATSDQHVEDAAASVQSMLADLVRSDAFGAASQIAC